MISTIVLEPGSFPKGEAGRALVVRSLAWLVGAAVAGVVGEVVLAASPDLALTSVADAVGSRLAEADDEGGRLQAAASLVRPGAMLVIVAGHAPGPALVEELARHPDATARLLAEPATLLQRLAPGRAPVVGVLARVEVVKAARDFKTLARAARGAPALATRARPLA